MMDVDSLAQALFGGKRAETQEVATDGTTRTYIGRAVSDSEGGTVRVDLGGDVTLPDDLYDEDGNVVAEWDGTGVEVSTSPQVREGQDVIVTLVGGTSTKRPMVTAVAGEGDAQAEAIDGAAQAAQEAWDHADKAAQAATAAQASADSAAQAAGEAKTSADEAAESARTANQNATKAIGDAAAASAAATAAQGSADSAAESARTAQQTAEAAQQSANTAQGAANTAQTSANAANAHATAALNSLSTVEDVVDTLTWITEHGTMAKTADTAVDPSKVYFVRDNNGDYTVGGNRYSIVQEPVASALSSYYELTIDKSVENYIATHLSVTNEGLWLTPTQSGGYRVLVATGGAGKTYPTAGTYIIDGSGVTVAQFTGTGISFADDRTFYIGDESAYIFFDGNGHINIGGSNVTIGGSTTLAELLAKYDATITSDDISVSKTGGTATITVGGDSVTISDGATGAQGPKGDQGEKGETGETGPQGPAGHSPAITTSKNSDGSVTIYVDGTATSTVDAGEDGQTPTITTTKNSDGSVTIYVNGTASNTVEAGADGTSYYTYVRYSANASGSGMVTTPTSATKYIGVYTGTSSSVPAYTSFKWSKYVGEDGNDADPLTVTSHAVDYQLSTSGTTAPTGTWSTTPLAPTTTQYLWTRTTLKFSDNTTSVSYSVGGKAGTDGQNGTNGTNGTDGGRWYAGTKITGTSTTATAFSGSGITAAVVGDMYLNTSTYNTYRCTVAGNASTAKWVYTANIKGQTGAQGPQGETGPQGPQGETGSAGTNGVSITGVEHQYYLSTSSTSQTGGSWTVKPAAYVKGRYYWERWKVSFSSGNPTYTTATLAEEVTSAWTAIDQNDEQIALKANSADVNALAGRVTTAESNISQNSEQIALRATKTEVARATKLKDSGSGASVVAEGAVTAAPSSLAVYGKSVQNGTPTPSAPVDIQSVGAVNLLDVPDGIYPKSGTTTGYYIELTVNNGNLKTLNLEAGKTYTISFDIKTSVLPCTCTVGAGDGRFLRDGNGFTINTNGHFSASFTVTSSFVSSGSVFALRAPRYGSSTTFTYSISNLQVIEAEAPCDYLPYDAAGLSVKGRNLVNQENLRIVPNAIGGKYITSDGHVASIRSDSRGWNYANADWRVRLTAGTYTLSANVVTPSTNSASYIQIYDSEGVLTTHALISNTALSTTGYKSASFEVPSETIVGIMAKLYDGVIDLQLEAGSTATEYEPYRGTVTPIPLQGHQLRSLPDGTRDELTVDADGRVTMVQRVRSMIAGDYVWNKSSNRFYVSIADAYINTANGGYKNANLLSNSYVGEDKDWLSIGDGKMVLRNSVSQADIPALVLYSTTTSGMTTAQFKAASTSVEVFYPLATPQTIDLGTIDMPSVQDGDVVEVIASLTPVIDVTWYTSQGLADEAARTSALEVTAAGISSTVSEKVGYDEVISSINQSAESVSINANKINLQGAVTISDLASDASTSLTNAAKTATSYVTDITGGGIMVHPSGNQTTGVQVTSDVDILRSGTSVANYGTTARIGTLAGKHVSIDSDSVDLMDGNANLATFGANDTHIGMSGTGNVYMANDKFLLSAETTEGETVEVVSGLHAQNIGANYRVYSGIESTLVYDDDGQQTTSTTVIEAKVDNGDGTALDWANIRIFVDPVNKTKIALTCEEIGLDAYDVWFQDPYGDATSTLQLGKPVQRSASSNVSITSTNTWIDGPSVSLDAGYWMVVGVACFNTGSSSGSRKLRAQLRLGSSVYSEGTEVRVANNEYGRIQASAVMYVSSTSNATLVLSSSMNFTTATTSYVTAVQLA